MIEATLVHSCYHLAGLSAHSSTTNIWFFPTLNVVCVETVYETEQNNYSVRSQGGTERTRRLATEFLEAKRK